MATVTALDPSSEHPHHVNVRVDGRLFATVPVALVARLGLTLGATVDVPSHTETATETDAPTVAHATDPQTYQRAVGMLAVSARSVQTLRQRLLDKGEAPANVEQVLTRLTADGLLDDVAYAREVARTQVTGRARSVMRTEHELRRRGVAADVARAAVKTVLAEEGTHERSLAVLAAQRKLRTLTGADPRARREKLYGFLARQGYSMEAVRHALRVVLSTDLPDGAED